MELQHHLAALQAQGATVLAASLDPVSTSQSLARQMGLRFPILQDSAGNLGAAFGDFQNSIRAQDGDAIVILDRRGRMGWRRYGGQLITASEVQSALAQV